MPRKQRGRRSSASNRAAQRPKPSAAPHRLWTTRRLLNRAANPNRIIQPSHGRRGLIDDLDYRLTFTQGGDAFRAWPSDPVSVAESAFLLWSSHDEGSARATLALTGRIKSGSQPVGWSTSTELP